MARLGIRKSAARQIDTWLGIRKSVDGVLREGDPAFKWYKKRILALIKERLNAAGNEIKKASYPVGTPRVWSDGNTYVKIAPGKWRRKFDAGSAGDYHYKGTLTRFYKRIAGCTDSRQIQATIRSFVLQFRDKDGYPMKWVPDFLGDARQALADAKRMAGDEIGAQKIEAAHRREAKRHGYSGARNVNYEGPENVEEEEEKWDSQIADMKAKVDEYLADAHTLKELKALQEKTQELVDNIKNKPFSSEKLQTLERKAKAINNAMKRAVVDVEEWERTEDEMESVLEQEDALHNQRMDNDPRYKKLIQLRDKIYLQQNNDKILERYQTAYLNNSNMENYHRVQERYRIYDKKKAAINNQITELSMKIWDKLMQEGALDELMAKEEKIYTRLQELDKNHTHVWRV